MNPDLHGAKYIGDGAYVRMDDDRVVIFTSNGLGTTNRVVLEPDVLVSLIQFLKERIGARMSIGGRL
jgi:hypothetical protein